jgi:hypothetical protein
MKQRTTPVGHAGRSRERGGRARLNLPVSFQPCASRTRNRKASPRLRFGCSAAMRSTPPSRPDATRSPPFAAPAIPVRRPGAGRDGGRRARGCAGRAPTSRGGAFGERGGPWSRRRGDAAAAIGSPRAARPAPTARGTGLAGLSSRARSPAGSQRGRPPRGRRGTVSQREDDRQSPRPHLRQA